MHDYAQTNIQLYNQLRRGCYSELELERIRNAYDLAIVLFSGHFDENFLLAMTLVHFSLFISHGRSQAQIC